MRAPPVAGDDRREHEISKHTSPAQWDPVALKLCQNGECFFDIPEALYDMTYPGRLDHLRGRAVRERGVHPHALSNSLRREFPDASHRFLHPPNPAETTSARGRGRSRCPFRRGGRPPR